MTKKLMTRRKALAKGKKRPVQGGDDLDVHAVGAAHMLYDPCGADLVPSVYPGDKGYINRFVTNFTAATIAGETTFYSMFKAGVNVNTAGSAANATTNFPGLGFADTQAPGAAFLNTTASKLRCLGACYQVRVNAAPNNCTGMLYYGVVPASTFVNGTVLNFNEIAPFLTQSVSCSQVAMQPLEIKWVPGLFDEKYCDSFGIVSDDDSDRNMIVIAGTGLPAATGVNIKSTGIYEWTPSTSTRITIDSTGVNPSRCTLSCVLRNLKRKDADWWWALGKKTLTDRKSVV